MSMIDRCRRFQSEILATEVSRGQLNLAHNTVVFAADSVASIYEELRVEIRGFAARWHRSALIDVQTRVQRLHRFGTDPPAHLLEAFFARFSSMLLRPRPLQVSAAAVRMGDAAAVECYEHWARTSTERASRQKKRGRAGVAMHKPAAIKPCRLDEPPARIVEE